LAEIKADPIGLSQSLAAKPEVKTKAKVKN